MSAPQWSPDLSGEVAIISWQSASKRHGGTAAALRCSREYDESHWTTQTFGEIADDIVTKVRPFVVIDPENAEQVAQLVRAFWTHTTDVLEDVDAMTRALRALLEGVAR